jgi:acetyltransferase-like isoleucine patch superfamily enzyme
MFRIGKDCQIHPTATINVHEGCLGDRSIVREFARIEGAYVSLGNESYLNIGAWIGGGSCWDREASLEAGCWLHMGWNSHINIARGVKIGEEVGVGVETKIFTHGAYLPVDMGFPVQWAPVHIGSRVWLPNAWVNPGVKVGNDVVVAARSLVNVDLPNGCFAGGIPVRILREDIYPKRIKMDYRKVLETVGVEFQEDCGIIWVGSTEFNILERQIEGPSNEKTELIKGQLRRNGIRFKFFSKGGEYVPWE